MARIQLLTIQDTADYRQLRLEALRDSPSAFGSSYEEELGMPPGKFSSRLEENHVFGAFTDQSQLVGIVGLCKESRIKRAHNASLVGMYVSSSFRQQGIGGALLDRVIEFARQLGGVRTIKLSVTDGNRAAASLYESRGFKRFGLEPDALLIDGKYLDEEQLILRLEI